MLEIKTPLLFIRERGNKAPFRAVESSAFDPQLGASCLEDVNKSFSLLVFS